MSIEVQALSPDVLARFTAAYVEELTKAQSKNPTGYYWTNKQSPTDVVNQVLGWIAEGRSVRLSDPMKAAADRVGFKLRVRSGPGQVSMKELGYALQDAQQAAV